MHSFQGKKVLFCWVPLDEFWKTQGLSEVKNWMEFKLVMKSRGLRIVYLLQIYGRWMCHSSLFNTIHMQPAGPGSQNYCLLWAERVCQKEEKRSAVFCALSRQNCYWPVLQQDYLFVLKYQRFQSFFTRVNNVSQS